MNIKVGVSNRHIHLCEKDFKSLFGEASFGVKKELSQDGEFASNFVLSVMTNKGSIDNVRVIGPLRDRTQVEISRTDAYKLGLNPPVRMSGDFRDAEDIMLSSIDAKIVCKNCCIIANRHIHVNSRDVHKYGLFPDKAVRVRVRGDRGGILDNILIKVKDNYNLELHLDTDEANAMGISNGDEVEIVEES
jgi:putative phosphotransacetylase